MNQRSNLSTVRGFFLSLGVSMLFWLLLGLGVGVWLVHAETWHTIHPEGSWKVVTSRSEPGWFEQCGIVYLRGSFEGGHNGEQAFTLESEADPSSEEALFGAEDGTATVFHLTLNSEGKGRLWINSGTAFSLNGMFYFAARPKTESCEGKEGKEGKEGPAGKEGPPGPEGKAGAAGGPVESFGSSATAEIDGDTEAVTNAIWYLIASIVACTIGYVFYREVRPRG